MKIVVLDGYTLNPGDLSWARFEALGDLTVYDRTPREEIIARIGDAPVVIVNKTHIRRETLEACPAIRYVGVLATGYNTIDMEAAGEKGVVVTNVPAYSTMSVAQLTFALLLEACHHVGEISESVRAGAWAASRDFCFWEHPMVELDGKTMGIIGYGNIGRAVARIAAAFGLRVLTPDRGRGETDPFAEFVPLDRLYAESDIVSLHCPLNESTRGMINSTVLENMKDGAILLNTARGPLLNEQDVAAALARGKLTYAAVDVLSSEPPKADNPLLSAKNCFITPHIAWAPVECRERLMRAAAGNLAAFLSGKPVNVVSP